jgi:hypothetical protein
LTGAKDSAIAKGGEILGDKEGSEEEEEVTPLV